MIVSTLIDMLSTIAFIYIVSVTKFTDQQQGFQMTPMYLGELAQLSESVPATQPSPVSPFNNPSSRILRQRSP